MTGMEQGLRYIEREVRFMVKDQFGNPTYAKYADRVIEDACGIPNFCSTVLSSKRPLTAILRAVRGPRGDVIMRFFNSALHDTRIEMVMVLAEVVKLRSHNNRNSKNAHDYLMKLYRKANKRMVRLITGSKNKESFKSMYRGLRDFAKMDDFDYDDEDEDDIDDYFETNSEFGDSDYAEACLNAYRDGKNPPEIDVINPSVRMSPSLKGNEEILSEIAAIESKLGRHLTDAELDNLLCGDDDDDLDQPGKGGNLDKTSEAMMDSIVEQIYNRVLDRLMHPMSNDKFETLDEFIGREELNSQDTKIIPSKSESVTSAENTDNLKSASTEVLVGVRNKLKNDVPMSPLTEMDSENILDTDDKEEESDSEETDSLPPSEMLGGNYNEADFIDVNNSDDNHDNESDEIDVNSEEIYATEGLVTSDIGLNVSDTECSPNMKNMLILSDTINDCKLADAEITNALKNRIGNYFDRIGITTNDIFVSLTPSNGSDKLFTLVVIVRISGDYEIINMMHLNTVILMHTKNIAERFGISGDLIDTEFEIVDATSTFKSDLMVLNTNNKDFTPKSVDNVNSALSAISTYIYRRLEKLIEVKFINDPNSTAISVYFSNKDNTPIDTEFEEFFNEELIGESILDEIMTNFDIGYQVKYYLINDNKEFFITLKKVLETNIKDSVVMSKHLAANYKTIKEAISNFDKEVDNVCSDIDTSIGVKNMILDIIYFIYTKETLTESYRDDLETQLGINGEYSIQLENLIRAICMNTEVNNYIVYNVSDNDDADDDDTDEDDDTPKTSNFGI